MKKFLKIIWLIILAIITIIMIVGGFALGLWEMFSGIWEIILDIGGGSWLKGLIFLPFGTIGVIQIVRGFFSIIQKDIDIEIPYDKLPTKTKIFILVYWIITICSYAILFIIIEN